MGMLSSTKSANSKPKEVEMAHEGHLLRFMKQVGRHLHCDSLAASPISANSDFLLKAQFQGAVVTQLDNPLIKKSTMEMLFKLSLDRLSVCFKESDKES